MSVDEKKELTEQKHVYFARNISSKIVQIGHNRQTAICVM